MMYEGYRLKINDVIFPNHFMKKGTWKCLANKRRLIDSLYDADGTRHEAFSPAKKLEIRFQTREGNLDDHTQVASFFAQMDNVPITFWNDNTCEYETRICKIHDITWTHSNGLGDDIRYNAASIVITED